MIIIIIIILIIIIIIKKIIIIIIIIIRVTLIPWKHGKFLAWDVTMSDTFAASHLPTTAFNHGSAAESSATLKTQKYANIVQTHIFTPVAIETSGVLSVQARELLREPEK